MADRIDRRRSEFPTLESGIHLLSHSLGPMPLSAGDSMREYLDRWRNHTSEDAWAGSWWDLSKEVGDHLAAILGAAPGTVAIQPSASVALSVAVSCLPPSSAGRPRVVTTALDFPSMGYIWQAQARLGYEIITVPSDDGVTFSIDRLLESIDARTALVALSHVSYRSSFRAPVEPIVKRAREAGAKVLLDVYQSAGVAEFDAAGWRADFLIGGTIKWLLGGPACGYLYVRPDLIPALRPRLTGWVAHARPFDFAAEMDYDSSIRRFAQGTPNIPGLYSCLPGLRIVREVGVTTMAAENRRRTEWMVEFARGRGWRLNSPADPERRGGSVMIGVPDGPGMVRRLAERKVFVDSRPGVGLRMSPHFFNTDDEVRRAMEILAELMA